MKSDTFYRWRDIREFFYELNKENIRYVVMRNYEMMHLGDFFCGQHEDIDILVDDSQKFREIAHAYPKMWPEDDIHFVIFVDNECIPLDVRKVGDSYYDEKWERDILERRKLAENGNWYVMDEEDYYYSLAYHAIFQKERLSEEYLNKLNVMAQKLGVSAGCQAEHEDRIREYFHLNNYEYTIPLDKSVLVNFHSGAKGVVKKITSICENLKQRLYESRLWDSLKKCRCVYWNKEFCVESQRFKDLDRLCGKIQRKFGEDVYDQLAEARVDRYIERYREEIEEEYFLLKNQLSKERKETEEGRTVFTMWQQGADCAPMVIKACISSIERFAANMGLKFVVLDDNNIADFVDIPDFITEKYVDGKLGRAHYSDLIRLLVLLRYGGIWVDSSVYIPDKVPEYMVNVFFVFTQSPQLREKRKYGNWWIASEAGNEILLRTLAHLFVWWKHEEYAFHYYIFHIFWNKVIAENEHCRQMIDNMPIFITDSTHALVKSFDKEYSEDGWRVMKQISPVFKCSYKVKGFSGASTYYCKLCEGELR